MAEFMKKYIKRENFPVHPSNIKFRTAFKNCIFEALRRRGWKETDGDLDWDIIWAERDWINEVLDQIHLQPNQRVNHFRNYYELCRKDNLAKHLKRYKKALQKEGKHEEAQGMDFFPITYSMPAEYSNFVDEFKKHSNSVWIMKPVGRSQGKGIFLFTKLSQVSQWKCEFRWKPENPQAESYVVQKYLSNPLLVGGKKFDLRIYVLVTSYTPLVAYLYRTGFARFTHHRYSSNPEDIANSHMHLTNVAVQKTSVNYDADTGGKWDLRLLKLFLMSKYGQEKVNDCFFKIEQIFIRSLLSVQRVMIHDKHCFELYGYDILVDENLKPWIIEVNASPSMTANTEADFEMKCSLLDDAFTVLDLEKVLTGNEEQIGGFDIMYRGGLVTRPANSVYKSYLGCYNNRATQLKKIAKAAAQRLAGN